MAFTFQARTGKLDLRKLSKIDLERIAKTVDVDSLQNYVEDLTYLNLREEDLRLMTDPHVIKLFRIAQLMIEYLIFAQEQLALSLNRLSGKYTEQKRSLIRKRRELADLLESTKHLEAEVASKKQSLSTLETMLKTAHGNRASVEEAATPTSTSSAPSISFYITGPNGLTVEYAGSASEFSELTVQQLVDKIGPSLALPVSSSRLVYRGKTSQPDALVSSLDIRHGDSVMAVAPVAVLELPTTTTSSSSSSSGSSGSRGGWADSGGKKVEDGTTTTTTSSSSSSSISAAELKELFSQQHASLQEVAKEIRQGWAETMQVIATSPILQQKSKVTLSAAETEKSAATVEIQVFERMDERWNKLEIAMKAQLDQQLSLYTQHLQELAKTSHRINAGDIESDEEGGTMDEVGAEYKRSLTFIEKTVLSTDTAIAEMRNAHTRQSIEIAELKKLFSHEAVQEVVIVPQPVEKESVIEEVVEFENLSVSMETSRFGGGKEEDVTEEEVPDVPIKVVESKYASLDISFPKKATLVETVVEDLDLTGGDEEIEETNVKIVFPLQFNSDLVVAIKKGEDSFSVSVLGSLTVDDLVFELRRAIADLVPTSLQKVALNLRGKIVTLGVDVDSSLTPLDVARLAAAGDLVVKLASGSTMSDAAIDVLVEQWQRSQTKPGQASQYDRDIGLTGTADEQRHSLIVEMRGSLGDALSGLHGLDGLSTQELDRRMRSLQSTASTLPDEVADTLLDHRRRSIEALSALSSDNSSSDEKDDGVTLSIARKRGSMAGGCKLGLLHEEEAVEEDDDDEPSGEHWDGRIGGGSEESYSRDDDTPRASLDFGLALDEDPVVQERALRSSPFRSLLSANSSLNLSESND